MLVIRGGKVQLYALIGDHRENILAKFGPISLDGSSDTGKTKTEILTCIRLRNEQNFSVLGPQVSKDRG